MIRVTYKTDGKREYWLSNLGEVWCAIIRAGKEVAWFIVASGIGTRSPVVIDPTDKQAPRLVRARPEALAFVALHKLGSLTLADRFALQRRGEIPTFPIGGY